MREYDLEFVEPGGALTVFPAPPVDVVEVEVVGIEMIEILVPGATGPPGPPGVVKVLHGSDPNVLRPDAPLVYWVGTVQPVNADPDDLLMLKEA